MTTLIAFLIVLAVVVVVHELGHEFGLRLEMRPAWLGPAEAARDAASTPSADALVRMPLGTALAESARLSWDTTTETGVVIGRSLGGRAPPGGVIGVVGMAWLSGRVAERLGWRGLIDLAAMFSLGVGLLNLVPVVPLDGGHLALLAVERLRRRDVSARVRLGLALAGLALMIVLLVTTVVLDLRWMSRAA